VGKSDDSVETKIGHNVSGLRNNSNGVLANEARSVNTSRLVLIDLLTVTAEESLFCGLSGGKEVTTAELEKVRLIDWGSEVDTDIAIGKVGSKGQGRDRNVRSKRMAEDDIAVLLGVIGELEELDSGADVGRAGVDSDGNHAVFRGKVHKRGSGKKRKSGASGPNPEGNSNIAPPDTPVKPCRTQTDRKCPKAAIIFF